MNKIIVAGLMMLVVSACNPQQPVPQTGAGNSSAAGPSVGRETSVPYKVVNWGQQSTEVDAPFNVQADGNSGISFELNQPAPDGDIRVLFDDQSLPGVVANGIIVTATIPDPLLAKQGKHMLALELPGSPRLVVAGTFEVE